MREGEVVVNFHATACVTSAPARERTNRRVGSRPRPAGFRSARESSRPVRPSNPIRSAMHFFSSRSGQFITPHPPQPSSGDQPTNRHLSKQSKKPEATHASNWTAAKFQSIRSFGRSADMDKVLAFSILSASPADIAAGAGAFPTTRLSWRRGGGGQGDSAEATRQRDGEKQGGSPRPHGHGGGKDEPAAFLPRFAPEFDGIDCFETIVAH
uniref:Uncharacterized protein n=1 Tax=Setaria viridis TaxID=4556 RepID=A0A4U6V6L4_SETVI|nr:uncharacterized protein LOC117851439 [Setaria viridis]TKW19477.1 hypothetical protein SEVIR_4G022500v2 [Setaria viridis]